MYIQIDCPISIFIEYSTILNIDNIIGFDYIKGTSSNKSKC